MTRTLSLISRRELHATGLANAHAKARTHQPGNCWLSTLNGAHHMRWKHKKQFSLLNHGVIMDDTIWCCTGGCHRRAWEPNYYLPSSSKWETSINTDWKKETAMKNSPQVNILQCNYVSRYVGPSWILKMKSSLTTTTTSTSSISFSLYFGPNFKKNLFLFYYRSSHPTVHTQRRLLAKVISARHLHDTGGAHGF